MGSPGLGREAEPGVTAAVATTAPGCPRVAAGLAWLHCEGDQRLERHQPFTRMVSGSVSVGWPPRRL